MVERLFLSTFVDLTVVRQILITLQRNVRYSSKISVWIVRKEIIELILNLEFERVTSDVHRLSNTSTRPFLLMIKGCSQDLQTYLVEYLCTFINREIEIKNTINEKYVAIVIKWMIENSIWYERRENISIELYRYIFALLHEERFPLIQKTILNALNSVFIKYSTDKENLFLENQSIINLEEIICLWTAYPDDVVAACLLTYGNCLVKLQIFEMHRNISDDIMNMLNILFETSSLEIISIRAGLCSILMEESNVEFGTTLSWFENKLNITFDETYNIFLQHSLYELKDELSYTPTFDNEISKLLETDSIEFVERLVIDLYNYLCDNGNSNYLSDPTPNYLEIALEVLDHTSEQFCDAVRRSSFGEEKFKSKLTLHCKNYSKHIKVSVQLYAAFGIVTVELVDMLEWYGDYQRLDCLKDLKQMFDHDVIESLFQLLNLTTSKKKYECLFTIFQSLVRTNTISLLEVYQRVSLINHLLYSDFSPGEWRTTEDVICEGLLDLSCFKDEHWSSFDKSIFTKCHIDEKFQREIKDYDTNCALFSTKNNLLVHLR